MNSQKTQLSWVKQQLRLHGSISRNEALRNYISRLGALILVLKKEGWNIEGDYGISIKVNGRGHRDYIYFLKQAPYIPKLVYSPEKNCMVYQQPIPNQSKLI